MVLVSGNLVLVFSFSFCLREGVGVLLSFLRFYSGISCGKCGGNLRIFAGLQNIGQNFSGNYGADVVGNL